ncbi:MAG: hypothetical protein ACTTIM_02340 [Campylobacter sp.]
MTPQRGLETGTDDYLVKPFDFKELLVRFRVFIRRNSDSIANEICAGKLKIYLSKSQLS